MHGCDTNANASFAYPDAHTTRADAHPTSTDAYSPSADTNSSRA
jgi:hypothetical protein